VVVVQPSSGSCQDGVQPTAINVPVDECVGVIDTMRDVSRADGASTTERNTPQVGH